MHDFFRKQAPFSNLSGLIQSSLPEMNFKHIYQIPVVSKVDQNIRLIIMTISVDAPLDRGEIVSPRVKLLGHIK